MKITSNIFSNFLEKEETHILKKRIEKFDIEMKDEWKEKEKKIIS